MVPKTAIVLAGGLGTRLRPMTAAYPKPLTRAGNRPLLEHILYGLRAQGVTDVVLATGYGGAQIETALGNGAALGINLRYCEEREPLGSGGAIRHVCEHFPDVCGAPFIVATADVLNGADLSAAFALHRSKGAWATIVFGEAESTEGFGVAEIEGDLVRAFYEKPAPGITASRWSNLALWIFEPCVLDLIPAGASRVEDNLFPLLLRQGLPIAGYCHAGYWLDVGTHARYLQAQSDALWQRFPCDLQVPGGGGLFIAPTAHIDAAERAGLTPPLLIAEDAVVGAGVTLDAAVIAAGCDVRQGAVVENSVLYDGVVIGEGARLRNCVVGPGMVIAQGEEYTDTMLFEQGSND